MTIEELRLAVRACRGFIILETTILEGSRRSYPAIERQIEDAVRLADKLELMVLESELELNDQLANS